MRESDVEVRESDVEVRESVVEVRERGTTLAEIEIDGGKQRCEKDQMTVMWEGDATRG